MTSNIRTKSSRYASVAQDWQLTEDLWGGTQTMRDAGTMYLPMSTGEDLEKGKRYNERLARTTLTNFYKKTIDKHTGKVFSRDLQLQDYDADITRWVNDIDLEGNNLTQFARPVFTDGYNKGVSYLFVDIKKAPPGATLLQERQMDLRPYLTHIKAMDVLDIRTVAVNGKQEPVMFRYCEHYHDYMTDRYLGQLKTRVRAFFMTPESEFCQFEVWEQFEGEWVLVDNGQTNFKFIPLVPFYTNRTEAFMGRPPLLELAEKTVQYWVSSSDLAVAIHAANMPILFIKGLSPVIDPKTGNAKEVVIGPNTIFHTDQKDAEVDYVNYDPSGIETLQKELEYQREEMTLLGLEPLVNTAKTATEADLNAAEANNQLRSYALALKDALEQSLIWMGGFDKTGGLNKTDTPSRKQGSILINTNFQLEVSDVDTFANVIELGKMGVLTPLQIFKEAQARGIVNPDLTPEDEVGTDTLNPQTTV